MKVYISLLILLVSSEVISLVFYEGHYSNTLKTYKNIDEVKGNRTFVQLALEDNGSYMFSGFIYNEKNEEKDCFEHNGKWSVSDDILTLEKENTGDYGKFIKYERKKAFLY